ncbi:hypothetical protein BHE74_00035405 [Ensete ventricosum]|nr:hypothetical protein GW17_00019384 [Ensete ventricosum]RWW57791.1 hypothetical protein BHE74_00035405 [Ensete ventricosum]
MNPHRPSRNPSPYCPMEPTVSENKPERRPPSAPQLARRSNIDWLCVISLVFLITSAANAAYLIRPYPGVRSVHLRRPYPALPLPREIRVAGRRWQAAGEGGRGVGPRHRSILRLRVAGGENDAASARCRRLDDGWIGRPRRVHLPSVRHDC